MITGKQADTGKKKQQYTKPGAGQLGRKLANIAMLQCSILMTILFHSCSCCHDSRLPLVSSDTERVEITTNCCIYHFL